MWSAGWADELVQHFQYCKRCTGIFGHELWTATERMRLRIRAAKMSFPCRLSSEIRLGLKTSGVAAPSRAAAPLQKKEPTEVVQASTQDASWASSYGGVQARPTGRRPWV